MLWVFRVLWASQPDCRMEVQWEEMSSVAQSECDGGKRMASQGVGGKTESRRECQGNVPLAGLGPAGRGWKRGWPWGCRVSFPEYPAAWGRIS